jgi:hypothetical protein
MRIVVCLLMLAVAAAGCSSPDSDEDDPVITVPATSQGSATSTTGAASSTSTPAGPQYTLAVSNFPTVAVNRNSAFSFQMDITGAERRTSDHIGAHFSKSAVPSPALTAYSFACNHVSGEAPGNYVVTCNAPNEAGTYYLRGHLRIGTDPGASHHWSAEQTFTVN